MKIAFRVPCHHNRCFTYTTDLIGAILGQFRVKAQVIPCGPFEYFFMLQQVLVLVGIQAIGYRADLIGWPAEAP